MQMNHFTRFLCLFILGILIHPLCFAQIQWQKSLGGTGYDEATSTQQTNDGGYIVAGESLSNDGDVTGNHGWLDYWIVKLAATGAIQWQKSLGGTGYDEANSIQQTNDGGYIVAGRSESNGGDVTGNHGTSDSWIVKLDATGSIQWQKSLGGINGDVAKSIQQTNDGGYIVAGESDSNDGNVTGNHGNGDSWIVKLAATGSIQWQKTLGGTEEDYAYSIQQTNDGGYIVAGASYSNDGDVTGNHGDYDSWIVKLDVAGAIQWQKSLGGTNPDVAHSIQQTNDGGYIVAGYSESNDGDVTGNHGNGDYWIVKLGAATAIEAPSISRLSISPNPTLDKLEVEWENLNPNKLSHIYLINALGQCVFSQKAENNYLQLDLSEMPSGVYFLRMEQAGKTSVVKKICKL